MSTRDPARRLRKLLDDLEITQFDLALKLGVHPSNVAQYLGGGRNPSAIICLYLAGLAGSEEERSYWVGAADLNPERRSLLLRALWGAKEGGANKDLLAGVAALLTDPQDDTDEAIGDLIRRTVQIRAQKRSPKKKKK